MAMPMCLQLKFIQRYHFAEGKASTIPAFRFYQPTINQLQAEISVNFVVCFV